MIYKVVFKKEDVQGVHVNETKFKGVSRVCTDKGNGVTFFDSEGRVLSFIPNESLLYIERVKPLKTESVSPATMAALFGKNAEQLADDIKRRLEKEVFVYGKFPMH